MRVGAHAPGGVEKGGRGRGEGTVQGSILGIRLAGEGVTISGNHRDQKNRE